jgi:hypothetical protein
MIKAWTSRTKQPEFYLSRHKEQLKNAALDQMDFFRTQIIKKRVECELTLNALFRRTQLKLALFQWQLKIANSAHKLF